MQPIEQSLVGTPKQLLCTVTANFTAEPIAEFLDFWFSRLHMSPVRLAFSPYNQVFQELLTPASLLACDAPGANLMLVRLEDWARESATDEQTDVIAKTTREFISSVTQFAGRATRPTILVLCPPSPRVRAKAHLAHAIESLEAEVRSALSGRRGISLIISDEVATLYPVDVLEDPDGDRQAHIPFTRSYWAALATILARKVRLLLEPPYKVIVLDGDNTLWGGVIGEVGAKQVQLDGVWRYLQEFMRSRKQQGVLLALASKNEVSDVADVFCRPEMVLRREDFVAWKVHWDPKSLSVAALARELDLGLDSFFFLDDNPVECAEVAASCPGVTCVTLPSVSAEIPGFLRHLWPLDAGSATSVDETRTQLYFEQAQRSQFRETAGSFRDFIDGLELQVGIAPLLSEDYDRAAQLMQRTNQFNTSGIRRTASELASLVDSGARRTLLVSVRDRFGDYGKVGLAVFRIAGGVLEVESLLLSCRVLGKGVEHRVVAELGRQAEKLEASELVVRFRRTDRNLPAQRFLQALASTAADGSFRLSARDAAAVEFEPETASPVISEAPVARSGRSARPDFFCIATELNSPEAVVRAVARELLRPRPLLANPLALPSTPCEERLTKIWEEVLHVAPIGVTDSFASLGGRSLQATSVASRIFADFGTWISFIDILSGATIRDLAPRIGDPPVDAGTCLLEKVRDPTLSAAQHRLWFLDQFIPYRSAYNIPVVRRIRGSLDVAALETALTMLISRHEVLRSTFHVVGSAPTVRVSDTCPHLLRRVDAQDEAEALTRAKEEIERPFDLSEGPLLRSLLVAIEPEDHLLVLNLHHIVADGWSVGVFLNDLASAYSSARAQREPSWTRLPISYSDFAAWQSKRAAQGEFDRDLDYWKQEFRGAPPLLELPADKPRPPVMSYQGGTVSGQTRASLGKALEALAEQAECTPFTVFLAVWQTLLYRYTQQSDIVVGVPVAGRSHPRTESLLGCFVNTLAIRTAVDPDLPFRKYLDLVRQKLFGALEHQDLPIERLVGELGLERDLSRTPLFQVVLVLQDTPAADFSLAPAKVAALPLHNGGSKFDLVLELTPERGGYGLVLEFNVDLFSPETAARILRHFENLLAAACESPEMPLASLPIMDENETREMLSFVNRESRVFEELECLHRRFERCVASSPDAPAVSCEGSVWSYGELNRRANRVAHTLIAAGVGPDVLVGICLDRSLDLVVAILAVLKAGGAYLPIDLSYPAERLAFMLADAQAPLLLTEKKLVSSLPAHPARTICLDDTEAGFSAQPESNPETAATLDQLAYVIYTSGSTGRPKGCMITHRNVARLMAATEDWYGFDARDVWTLFHSYAFDFSVWELWGALLSGGRLVVVPYLTSRSPEAFYELLAAERVTVLNQTPSAFRQLIRAEQVVEQKELALRYVIFGGEALDMQSLEPWFARHGDRKPQLVNMYGITETTVHVTYRPLSESDLHSASVIGVPIPDLQIYLLDQYRNLVPVGVPGEIYVGGAGLARGYLHRPELTGDRFIPDHLTGSPSSRLYKTGDLARFLPNRDIEYLGRIDHQVKIRGFRIELGEIEAVLGQYPGIQETAVIARSDAPGDRRLVAYLVTALPAPEVHDLRLHLKSKLPDYMVPAAFVFLDRFPLTGNGKIDRSALPAPDERRRDLADRYVAPRTPTEIALAGIWSKVLRIDRLGIHDNFFELGGDSILSIQMISLARREGVKLTPKLLFAHQTIAGLAAAAVAESGPATLSGDAVGELPLTPIQHWFFEQNLAEQHHYNQALMLAVAEPLERRLLEPALAAIGRHHDSLRLRFARENGRCRQFYAPQEPILPLLWVDLSGQSEQDRLEALALAARSAASSLDLENGPLWRVVYFDFGHGVPGRLLFIVHHLAVDGVSWRPLLEDLETAYCQGKAGQAISLPPKSTSYQVWSERLENFQNEERLVRDLPFWRELTDPLRVAASIEPLAKQRFFAENTEQSGCTLKIRFTSDETQALLQQVPAAYNTQINDALLAALLRAWHLWTGSRVLFTNLEGHGRENLFEDVDLSRTVGWFTSIFPVRLESLVPAATWHPGDALASVKEQLRRIPTRGLSYGLLRYLGDSRELAARPEPLVVFNYLGQFDQVVAGSGLFRFAPESSGAWHSPKQLRRSALEVNGLVIFGQLEFHFTYSQNMHTERPVAELAEAFAGSLREIVVHCQSPESGRRTPSDFPLARLDQPTIDRLAANGNVEDIYPLSPIQTLFYSANREAPQTAFDQWHCTLDGPLDVPAFQRAWRETVGRHSILRSTIHGEGLIEPLQVVHRAVHLPWTVEDHRGLSREQVAEFWASFLKRDREQPLALATAPAMRFALVRVEDQVWRFLWSVPALLLDGWSWPMVFRDVSNYYSSFSGDKSAHFEPGRPYRDYIEWLSRQSSEESGKFWREHLAGFREPTPLPTLPPDAGIDKERYRALCFALDVHPSESLRATARGLQTTLGTLVQAAWALLLGRASDRSDVVFGAAFSGRPADLEGVESIVGPFVNNLPVRANIKPAESCAEWLRQFHSQLMSLSAHQFTPLVAIQQSSEIPWRHRLFDSLVVFQNYHVDDAARGLGGQVGISEFVGPVHTNYSILLLVEPGDALRLTFIYDSQTIERSTIETWSRDLTLLLERIPQMLNRPIQELQAILSAPPASPLSATKKIRTQSQNFVPAQSEIEKTIVAIWQRMFGLEQVSIEDNLFDLGGHSLLIVQMHARLRETLHADFPIVSLFEHPTVRSLSRFLEKPAGPDTESVIRYRDRADRQKQALSDLRVRLKKV